MKMSFFAFLMVSFLSLSAFAVETPLLVKSDFSGFTSPEYTRHFQCEIFRNGVRTTRRFGDVSNGGFQVVESKTIIISGDIEGAILKAELEQVEETPNNLCDGPGSQIMLASGSILFATGGCGSPRQKRIGPVSYALHELTELHCGKVIEFGEQR